MKTKEEIIQKTVEFLKEFNFKSITWNQALFSCDGYVMADGPDEESNNVKFYDHENNVYYCNDDCYFDEENYKVLSDEILNSDSFFRYFLYMNSNQTKKYSDLIDIFGDGVSITIDNEGNISEEDYISNNWN
jgi:hypothetical protein